MADFTPTQGRYLAFICAYIHRHGYPPAESDIAAALCVSAPSVNRMVIQLEKKSLILRNPGQPRSIRIIIPVDEIPPWNGRKQAELPAHLTKSQISIPAVAAPPVSLYVLMVSLDWGPIDNKYVGKAITRQLEIRGDQTLEELHRAIFGAYDRRDERAYEFQFGKRPYDPDGPNYGDPSAQPDDEKVGDARTTRIDDLGLETHRGFGYRFDFDAEWFHQIWVVRIDRSIPTVRYPRITRRVGQSPPQYPNS